MRIRSNIWLQIAAVITDAGAVIIGAWLAYVIRFSELFTSVIPIVTALPPLGWYFRLSLLIAALTVLFQLSGGMYRFPRQEELLEEIFGTLKRFLSACVLLLAALFFYREVSFSRVTMTLLLLFTGGSLVIFRSFGRRLREWLYRRGIAIMRAAVIGGGEHSTNIIEHILSHPHFGLKVVGSISDRPAPAIEPKRLGSIADAGKIVREQQIDTLIVTPKEGEPDTLPRLVKACYGVNVDFLYMPDIQPANGRLRRIIDVGGTPLWTLKESPFEGWQGLLKRSFDVFIALILLILLFPLLFILAAAIKIESRGSIFFRQQRVGLDREVFNCLKFRSMKIDAEDSTGPVWTKPGDPRVTRVGRILRRWCLDELPQLWNVLRGDMSLVGPRPERPEFVSEFEQRIDGYQERHRVRSGITGWAQVNGLRGDTPIEDRTAYDRYYVENWSLMFDLKILLLTLTAVIRGKNAY